MGVGRNALYITAMQVSNVLLGLLLTPYVTRVLGSDLLGISSYGFAVVGYFGVFGLLGLPIYGLREVARLRENPMELQRVFSEGITYQLFFTALAMVAFTLWAISMPDGNSLYYLLFLLYLLGTGTDLTWFYGGLERYDRVALRTVCIRVVGTFSIVLFVRDEGQLALFIILQQGAVSLSNLFYWTPLHHYGVKIRLANLRSTLRRMLRPALLLFLPSVLSMVIVSSDRLFIHALEGTRDVAIYDFPARFARIGITMVTVVGNVMMPRLANLYENGREAEFRSSLAQQLFFGMFTGFLIGGGLIATAGPVSVLMFGPTFEGSAPVLSVLAAAVALTGMALYHAAMSIGREKGVLKTLVIGAVSNVILNLLLIPLFGILGAAYAYVLTEAIIEGQYLWLMRDTIDIGRSTKQLGVFMVLSALALIPGFVVRVDGLILAFLLKGTAFVAIFISASLLVFPSLRGQLWELVRSRITGSKV